MRPVLQTQPAKALRRGKAQAGSAAAKRHRPPSLLPSLQLLLLLHAPVIIFCFKLFVSTAVLPHRAGGGAVPLLLRCRPVGLSGSHFSPNPRKLPSGLLRDTDERPYDSTDCNVLRKRLPASQLLVLVSQRLLLPKSQLYSKRVPER